MSCEQIAIGLTYKASLLYRAIRLKRKKTGGVNQPVLSMTMIFHLLVTTMRECLKSIKQFEKDYPNWGWLMVFLLL